VTDPTEPIRRSELPCIPSPEWEFHTWFPHLDGGGDMVPGQRHRGVLVRRRVSYSDWEPVRPDRWAAELPTDDLAAAPAVPAPATGRDATLDKLDAEQKLIRDHTLALHQIGEQLSEIESWFWAHLADVREAARQELGGPLPDDVVPAMPSAPTDQTALAWFTEGVIERCPDHGCVEPVWADGCHCELVPLLRRLAGEAACVHPDGYDGECPCPPSCTCCTATAVARPGQPETAARCPDAFWLRRPEEPHTWEQSPTRPQRPCPGVPSQPETDEEARRG